MRPKKIEAPMPDLWEHAFDVAMEADVPRVLTVMGDRGWELVTATRHNAIYSLFFKRKK